MGGGYGGGGGGGRWEGAWWGGGWGGGGGVGGGGGRLRAYQEVSTGGASCPFEPIPCRLVLPNLECHILDRRLSVMKIGQWGDVYLSGPSLAVGYLDRPNLTAERFVCLSLPDALDDSQVFYLHLHL